MKFRENSDTPPTPGKRRLTTSELFVKQGALKLEIAGKLEEVALLNMRLAKVEKSIAKRYIPGS